MKPVVVVKICTRISKTPYIFRIFLFLETSGTWVTMALSWMNTVLQDLHLATVAVSLFFLGSATNLVEPFQFVFFLIVCIFFN
jgi:hypothetical protein